MEKKILSNCACFVYPAQPQITFGNKVKKLCLKNRTPISPFVKGKKMNTKTSRKYFTYL